MKKLAVVLLLFLLLCAFPAGYAGAADTLDAGSCGSNLLWVLDSDGILTISGQGDMYDYAGDSTDDPPWYHLRTSITKVHVTDSVTDIGDYAFWNCDNLSDIVLPAALTSIGAGAFGGCSMSSINLPQSLECIGDHAFSNCERLTSITIPEGVTSIGDYTFSNCGKLTSADLPDGITDIGYGAFSDCVRLSYITLPDSVQSIGDYAFSNCSGLTGITVPDGTTDIGSWAFAYSGLTGITIPNSVVRIGDSAFSGCNSLSQVNYGGTAAQWAEISIGSDNAPLLTAELNSIQALSIAEQPVDYTGAVGSTATFKVVAQGDGLTYQWYCKKTGATSFAKSTLSSATKATLSLTLQEKHDSYQYYCKVKDSHGNSVNSNTVKITVGTPLKITTQPVNFTGAAGSTASLKVVAQGDGLTYQWYCKKTGATSFAKSTLSSATKATLSLTLQEKHDSYQYYCKVKDSHGNSVNSNTVKITVGTPLKITTQPVNFTGAAGSTASLKVVAQGDGLTYQWYVKKTGETSFAKSTVSSATKATFTMTLADRHDGYQYYCKVKDSHGNTINSNTVKITVGTALKITTQPSNFTGAVGSTATFKTVAQGDGLTYQWYYKKTGETSFAKSTLASGTKATYTMTIADRHDGWQYYCLVKDSRGNSVKTNTVSITVATPLKITTQPANYTGAAGSTASLKVVAQGDGLTYQWYCKKTGATSFAKSTLSSATKATLSLTLQEKHDGYQYYCKVKDIHGNSVNSNTVKITVAAPLKITSQPVDFSGQAGDTVRLTVKASGSGLTYQWYYKKTGATSFTKSTLAAGTKATYTMTIADRHDGWQYYCLVKDSSGSSVRSNTVTIHVVSQEILFASEVVRLVNIERAAAGLDPLTENAVLDQAATIRSSELITVFSHTRPDDRHWSTVLGEVGFNYQYAGENIARGQLTPEEVVAGWMNSEGHRKNILGENFHQIGVGLSPSTGAYSGYAWVQLFTD